MQLSLTLFGPFSAAVNDQPISESRTKKIEALLAYLVVEGDRPHRRETLMGLFFPEMPDEAASTNLRQTLTRLRHAIQDEAASPPFLTITRESIQFNRQSEHWCDLLAFAALLSGCAEHRAQRDEACSYCMTRAREALELYRGPFLADFFLADSAAFEAWAATYRERWQQQALAALQALTTFHTRRGEYVQAIAYIRRQVALEPWQEEAHQTLMRLLARLGQRPAALAQYNRCVAALRAELDVEPSAATTALRDQIARLAATQPHHLPNREESFIGRDDELARIYAHCTAARARPLTLVGAGGMGKTRLALEVGWRLAGEWLGPFLHGVYFVALAEIGSAVDVEQALMLAIADSLGLALVGVRLPLDVVLGYVQDKELLLIVDNCEEAGRAIASLDKLLRHAPGLQILATSREPLDLAHEFLLRLEGLPFPPAPTATDPQPTNVGSTAGAENGPRLDAYQAVQLFAYHARRAMADFSFAQSGPSEQQALARICQVCAGMPLALEMAAVWVQALSCGEIASAIERNLDLLQSHSQPHLARHHSIRAVFDYSWQRLTPAERTLFAQLSVFRGSFDQPSAQTVAAATLPTLISLVRKSLLRYDQSRSGAAGRYAMHPLLRQYAAEKLAGDLTVATAVAARHGRYFCAWLGGQASGLQTSQQPNVIKAVTLEFNNVRAAWQWAVDQEDASAIDQAVAGLTTFCELRGFATEGQELLGAAVQKLQMAQRTTEEDATAIVVAKTLARQGWLNFLIGASALAQKQLQEALGILQVLGVTAEMVMPLNGLAYVAYCTDQYPLALEKSREARILAEAQGDRLGQANALRTTATVTQYQGQLQESMEQYETALALYQQIGNGQGACWSLLSLCSCVVRLGDFDMAIERGKEVVQICREIRYRLGEGWAIFGLGTYHVRRGDYAEAIGILQDAVQIGREMNDRRLQGSVLYWHGICLRSQDKSDQAQTMLEQTLAIFRDIDNALGEGEVLNEFGILARSADQPAKSLAFHQQALAIGQRIGNHELQCRTFTCLGHVYIAMQRYIQAQTAYQQALEHVDKAQPQQRVNPLSGLAYVAAQGQKSEQAEAMLREIRELLARYRLDGSDDTQVILWNIARAIDTLHDKQLATLYEPLLTNYAGLIARVQ